jgi:hypothetical protein
MQSTAASFRGLMAAVINRALADLKKNSRAIKASDHVRDEAMAWINGPECEAFCYALDTDYRAIREQAAALYRHFLEEADGRLKAPGRPRKSGARTGKPRPMTRPESQPQSIRRPRTAMVLARKEYIAPDRGKGDSKCLKLHSSTKYQRR